jgi:hypothetical protein
MKYNFADLRFKGLIAVAAIFLLFSILFGVMLTVAHILEPMDFGSFIASGEQATLDKNPYSYSSSHVSRVPINEFNIVIPSPNLNPPITVLLFQLICKTGSNLATLVISWKVISFCLYVVFIFFLIRAGPKTINPITMLWAFSLAGFWQTIEVGQIYVPLLFITFFAWQNLKNKNSIAAGFFIGILIAIKPQFIFWALFLLCIDQKAIFIISAITSIAISIIPISIYGTEIYFQWFQAMTQYTGILLPGNTSIQSLFARLGNQNLGLWISLAFLGLMLLYVRFIRPGEKKTSFLAISTMLLVSPYSWSGYTLFLLPGLFSQGKWTWKKIAAAGLLAFPFLFLLKFFATNILNFISIGWIYGWAIVLLIWDGIDSDTNLA